MYTTFAMPSARPLEPDTAMQARIEQFGQVEPPSSYTPPPGRRSRVMSKLVQLLDLLGRNPELISDDAFAQAVSAFGLDDQVAEAVMAREPARLTAMLQLPSISYCALFPAEDEPVRENEDDQKDDSPDKEESTSLAA